MKEIIFADVLKDYLQNKIKKADDMLCSEEYRAGFKEACEEIMLYAPVFLTVMHHRWK